MLHSSKIRFLLALNQNSEIEYQIFELHTYDHIARYTS